MSDALQLKIRSNLPLAYVLEHFGHQPVDVTGDRLHYINPWRDDDTRPSLDIYWEDGPQGVHQRWGDYAEDASGDVYELTRRLMQLHAEAEEGVIKEVSFAEAQVQAMELYFSWSNDHEWSGAELGKAKERTPMGPEFERELLAEARPVPYHQTSVWRDLVEKRPGLRSALDISTRKLFSRTEDGALIYLVHHPLTGEMMGAMVRYPDGRKGQISGGTRHVSTPATAHELALGADHDHYILVEGETDLFATYSTFKDEAYVWGIPGAGMHPAAVGGDLIPKGAVVTLALDNDNAGRLSAQKWRAFLAGRGVDVRIAVVPEGKDMARLRPEEQRRVITNAQPFHAQSSAIQVVEGGYWRVRQGDEKIVGWGNDEQARQITDWKVDFNAVLVAEDGSVIGYRGSSHGREVVLPVAALTSPQRLSTWAAKVTGSLLTLSPSLVGELAGHIRSEGNFLPRIPAYFASGLHSGGFVWDDGYTGSAEAAVIPNEGRAKPTFPSSEDPDYVQWRDHGGPAEAFDALTSAYSSAITQPILAWLTASFLRGNLPKFPIAMIKGLSGSGKTTLLAEMHRTFTGLDDPVAADSITRYAMTVALESTNAFPVWIDEYRNSTSDVQKKAIETAVLDVHGGARRSSSAGGDQWHVVEAHARQAPFMVSGEMGFKQLAHIERSATIDLNGGHRGPIKPVSLIPTGYIGRLLMDYLTQSGRSSRIPVGVQASLNDSRPAYTQAVLEAGWFIFVDALLSPPIPEAFPPFEYDAQTAVDEASGVNPGQRLDVSLDHAMEAVYAGRQGAPAVWSSADGEAMYVSIPNLIHEAGRRNDLDLPSSRPQDIAASLQSYYGAMPTKAKPPKHLWPEHQNQMRVHKIDIDALTWAGSETS